MNQTRVRIQYSPVRTRTKVRYFGFSVAYRQYDPKGPGYYFLSGKTYEGPFRHLTDAFDVIDQFMLAIGEFELESCKIPH
jgi:hypothetical protein